MTKVTSQLSNTADLSMTGEDKIRIQPKNQVAWCSVLPIGSWNEVLSIFSMDMI